MNPRDLWTIDAAGTVRPYVPPKEKPAPAAKPAPAKPAPAPDPLAELQAKNERERAAIADLGKKIAAAEAKELRDLRARHDDLARGERANELRERIERLERRAEKRARKEAR